MKNDYPLLPRHISPDLVADLPNIKDNKKSTIKMKNKIFAIEAAPDAIPPKPNTAAIMATTKNITVQRNISFNFKGYKLFLLQTNVKIVVRKYRAINLK